MMFLNKYVPKKNQSLIFFCFLTFNSILDVVQSRLLNEKGVYAHQNVFLIQHRRVGIPTVIRIYESVTFIRIY